MHNSNNFYPKRLFSKFAVRCCCYCCCTTMPFHATLPFAGSGLFGSTTRHLLPASALCRYALIFVITPAGQDRTGQDRTRQGKGTAGSQAATGALPASSTWRLSFVRLAASGVWKVFHPISPDQVSSTWLIFQTAPGLEAQTLLKFKARLQSAAGK